MIISRHKDKAYLVMNTYGKVLRVTDKLIILALDRLIPSFAIPTMLYLWLERMKVIKPVELCRITIRD